MTFKHLFYLTMLAASPPTFADMTTVDIQCPGPNISGPRLVPLKLSEPEILSDIIPMQIRSGDDVHNSSGASNCEPWPAGLGDPSLITSWEAAEAQGFINSDTYEFNGLIYSRHQGTAATDGWTLRSSSPTSQAIDLKWSADGSPQMGAYDTAEQFCSALTDGDGYFTYVPDSNRGGGCQKFGFPPGSNYVRISRNPEWQYTNRAGLDVDKTTTLTDYCVYYRGAGSTARIDAEWTSPGPWIDGVQYPIPVTQFSCSGPTTGNWLQYPGTISPKEYESNPPTIVESKSATALKGRACPYPGNSHISIIPIGDVNHPILGAEPYIADAKVNGENNVRFDSSRGPFVVASTPTGCLPGSIQRYTIRWGNELDPQSISGSVARIVEDTMRPLVDYVFDGKPIFTYGK